MGQKVNPHGIRVGVIKDWDSRWFASKKVVTTVPPLNSNLITRPPRLC